MEWLVNSVRFELTIYALKGRCHTAWLRIQADPTGVAPVPWELQSHALLTELQIDMLRELGSNK